MDWRSEAEAHVRDVRDGVVEAAVEQTGLDAERALISITTREGAVRQIALSLDGCCEVAPASATPPLCYDSLHSLLLNTSPGYRAHFHESLRAKLAALLPVDDDAHASDAREQ